MDYLVLASDGLWDQVGNQEAAEIVARSCSVDEKIIPEENSGENDSINKSPPPKLRRVSLKSKRTGHFASPKQNEENWKGAEFNFGSENDNPPSKALRVSMTSQVKVKNRILKPRKQWFWRHNEPSID